MEALAEAGGSLLAAEGGRCSGMQTQQPTALLDLFATVSRAFEQERARGFTIGAHQPPESAARVDQALRAAVRGYVAAGHNDWRQLASFCDEHYVRHLVDESADCEMIVRLWVVGQCMDGGAG